MNTRPKAVVFDFFGVVYSYESRNIDPFLNKLVVQLKSQATVILMSNTSADEATFIRRFEQVAVFGHLYLASEAGINKSDSRWFDRVAADHNLLPRDVMLIDDDSHNVATAKAAGWDLSAIYKDAISLRTYLRQLGFVLDES